MDACSQKLHIFIAVLLHVIFLFSETNTFFALSRQNGPQIPRARYKFLEVAFIQYFSLLSKVAHENLQTKDLLI